MQIQLDDTRADLHAEGLTVTSTDLGLSAVPPWSISKRTLRGGRREGVELIRVDNGLLSFDLLPTRGMSLWRGAIQGEPIGWASPVTDGPIHPAHVNLAGLGGFGWLEGFDELLARCGLIHNGPPGQEGPFAHGLHGRIQNIPAHRVSLQISEEPPYELAVEGEVDEAHLFGPRLRMVTRYSTTPGSNRLIVRDEFYNLGDRPTPLVILYHWNLGRPFLEEGARMVAAAETVVPQTARAAEGIGSFDTFGPPEPGFAEQVYLFKLIGSPTDGKTPVLLRNASGEKAVVLRYSTQQLPCFTLWKNTMGLKEGYVTGLEPATNYPNPRDFERSQGRFVELAPGASHVAELSLEILQTAEEVASVEKEIQALQGSRTPDVRQQPCEPFAPTSS